MSIYRKPYDYNYTPCTKPSPDRFYVKILKQLSNKKSKTIDEIYSAIPGTEKRNYNPYSPKWVNWGILTGLVKREFVTKQKSTGHKFTYKITAAGLKFLKTI